ncbi:DNA helicase-2 / ATP-dependent DNA helicase PcrA [Draconibacterium orientale]|uniref:DNA 3'-5' helicase n=1 Tax=Draconibacterium orientale TaxID=1168034 RepID=X5DI50_9BACT|nr:UvrD-helicase domain-containing protein [Draconibacterium orientale]AHW60182.1 ATP-dependent DNA helicase [Draconibacterium orientale]SES97271.1 DNA helicase-2 / ATP-dependent DNA helicase PcrA [Draconibacterium orientale]
MFDYLQNLNEAQREAVLRTEGPALVIAGAGSGKTRVLTFRIANLLKQGAKPSSILSLTFTNKAAREMKERIASVVGENTARYLWMGTFHSIFARILRFEHEIIGYPSNFTIYDSADSKSLIKTIIKSFQLDDKIYKPGVVASRISMAKNNLITPNAYENSAEIRKADKSMRMPQIAQIYKEYAKRCLLSGAMDFDDLLLKTNVLFRDHPEVLKKYQERFGYVMVDEYQDTNYSQYLIVKKLAAGHKNICVVGDDAQSIYSFRGARIENILNFKSDYPEHKVFKLEQNYRSTQTIVNAANSIIAKNKRQIPKKVFSENATGKPIKLISALTDNEEGFLVAQEIAQSQLRDHYKYEDFAILYRTNMQSRIFEESLRKRNIPYKIYGGLSFYQRKEIKDLISYFRMTINPADNEALKRIINYPARGIGATTLAKLEAAAINNETSIWKIISDLPTINHANLNKGTAGKILHFVGLIQKFMQLSEDCDAFDTAKTIAEQTGILKELYNDKSPEGLSRHENIQELLNGIQEFSINAKETGEPEKLENYLEDVALLTDQDNEKEEDRNKVTLMTVHSSKGLEFKNVFVVGMEENLFPSNQNGDNKPETLEEERRLFYVALTRAEENAWFSYANQRYRWGNLDFCTPSRFLEEIDEQFLDTSGIAASSSPTRRAQSNDDIQPERYHKNPVRRQPPGAFKTPESQNFFNKKLVSLKESSRAQNTFQGDAPEKIQTGMVVEHQRFGEGKVINIEGVSPNIKATVFFKSGTQKQLLLKFAKLKIKG